MPNSELAREIRRRQMNEVLKTLTEEGIAVDAATFEVIEGYVKGKLGLAHLSVALHALRHPTPIPSSQG